MKRGRLRAEIRTLVATTLPMLNRAVTSSDLQHAAEDIAAHPRPFTKKTIVTWPVLR